MLKLEIVLVAGSFLFGGAGAVSFSLVMDNQESVSFFSSQGKDLLRKILSFQLLKRVKTQCFEANAVLTLRQLD